MKVNSKSLSWSDRGLMVWVVLALLSIGWLIWRRTELAAGSHYGITAAAFMVVTASVMVAAVWSVFWLVKGIFRSPEDKLPSARYVLPLVATYGFIIMVLTNDGNSEYSSKVSTASNVWWGFLTLLAIAFGVTLVASLRTRLSQPRATKPKFGVGSTSRRSRRQQRKQAERGEPSIDLLEEAMA